MEVQFLLGLQGSAGCSWGRSAPLGSGLGGFPPLFGVFGLVSISGHPVRSEIRDRMSENSLDRAQFGDVTVPYMARWAAQAETATVPYVARWASSRACR